jgi:hypothetical protein
MALTELLTDGTRRIYAKASFDLPQVTENYNFPVPLNGAFPCAQIFIAPGSVQLTGGQIVNWGGGWLRPVPGSSLPGADGTLLQGYVDPGTGSIQMQAVPLSSISTFPAGSLPLFVAHLDEAHRVFQLDDYRPR